MQVSLSTYRQLCPFVPPQVQFTVNNVLLKIVLSYYKCQCAVLQRRQMSANVGIPASQRAAVFYYSNFSESRFSTCFNVQSMWGKYFTGHLDKTLLQIRKLQKNSGQICAQFNPLSIPSMCESILYGSCLQSSFAQSISCKIQ